MKLLSLFLFCFCIFALPVKAQQWQTKTGELFFEATDTSIEPVRARNSKVAALIDPESRKIAVLAKVRDFQFRVGLMQEHFNENYLESDRFPFMRFEGTFEGEMPLEDFEGPIYVEGTLKLHGVSQPLRTQTRWTRSGNQIEMKVSFTTRTADFGIKIPKVVIKKIAQEVEISGTFLFDLAGE